MILRSKCHGLLAQQICTTVFNSPSLGLLDDFLVQFESLRVPLAEGGLGDEALGVGDGGGAGREPGPRQLPPVSAEQAGSVGMSAPAGATGASASSTATSAQRSTNSTICSQNAKILHIQGVLVK